MTMKPKRGRPNNHLSEAMLFVRMPTEMLEQVKSTVRRAGGSVSAWVREAIRARLPK